MKNILVSLGVLGALVALFLVAGCGKTCVAGIGHCDAPPNIGTQASGPTGNNGGLYIFTSNPHVTPGTAVVIQASGGSGTYSTWAIKEGTYGVTTNTGTFDNTSGATVRFTLGQASQPGVAVWATIFVTDSNGLPSAPLAVVAQ